MSIKNWFNRSIKENPAFRSILAIFSTGAVAWTGENYYRLIAAGYKQGTPVYGCVKLITGPLRGLDWVVYEKTRDGQLRERPESQLNRLLNHPNAGQSRGAFIGEAGAFYLLAGNSFSYLNWASPETNELWNLRPDRTKILIGKYPNLVGGYQYQAAGTPIDYRPEDILHLKEFHPLDDFYGLSPLIVAMRSIDIANASKQWNYKMLSNDMRPPMAVIFKDSLTQAQRDALQGQLEAKYSGTENARRPMILEGGADVKPLATSPVDADWLEGDLHNLRNICSIFGISSELLGDAANKTYSNYQEGRKALYQDAVLPLADVMRDGFNNWLTPRFGNRLYVDYDRDKIEALQEDRGAKYVYINNAKVLTVNEKREALGYEQIDGGDVIMYPIGEIPLDNSELGQGGNGGQNQPADTSKMKRIRVNAKRLPPAEIKSFWNVPERKERLWRSFESRIRSRRESFDSLAKGYLKGQTERIKSALAGLTSLAQVRPEKILNLKKETELYTKTFRPWYVDHAQRAVAAGLSATKGQIFDDAEFKMPLTLTTQQMERAMSMMFNSGTKVNETIINQIAELFEMATADNETIEEFAQDIWNKVEDFPVWRARLWSRTESSKIDNWGQLEGYKQAEFVEQKGWLCSFVPLSRESHKEADRKYSENPIPLDDDFIIGGEAMAFPGDPKASAENDCNCLCSMYPVVPEV